MKKILCTLSVAALALSGCASSAPKAEAAAAPAAPAQNSFQIRDSLPTEDLQASYALGYEIGAAFSALKSSRIDYDAFVQGMMDTLSGRPLLVPSDSAGAIKVALFERIRGDMNKETLEKGAAFRAEWEKKEGAKKTETGLLYRVLTPSDSPKKPVAGDEVAVHYTGSLMDSTVFDSSVKRGTPFLFKLNPGTVIEGWSQILALMNEGEKVEVVIPPELAYGDRDMRVIPPNSTLIFEIELLKVNPDSAQVQALMNGQPVPPDQAAEPAADSAKAAPAAEAAKTEAKSEAAKPEAKADAKKAEPAKAEAKPAAAPAKAEEKKPEAKKAEAAPAKTEAKAEAAKPEAKADAKKAEEKKPEAKTEAKAAPKADAKKAEEKKPEAKKAAEAKK